MTSINFQEPTTIRLQETNEASCKGPSHSQQKNIDTWFVQTLVVFQKYIVGFINVRGKLFRLSKKIALPQFLSEFGNISYTDSPLHPSIESVSDTFNEYWQNYGLKEKWLIEQSQINQSLCGEQSVWNSLTDRCEYKLSTNSTFLDSASPPPNLITRVYNSTGNNTKITSYTRAPDVTMMPGLRPLPRLPPLPPLPSLPPFKQSNGTSKSQFDIESLYEDIKREQLWIATIKNQYPQEVIQSLIRQLESINAQILDWQLQQTRLNDYQRYQDLLTFLISSISFGSTMMNAVPKLPPPLPPLPSSLPPPSSSQTVPFSLKTNGGTTHSSSRSRQKNKTKLLNGGEYSDASNNGLLKIHNWNPKSSYSLNDYVVYQNQIWKLVNPSSSLSSIQNQNAWQAVTNSQELNQLLQSITVYLSRESIAHRHRDEDLQRLINQKQKLMSELYVAIEQADHPVLSPSTISETVCKVEGHVWTEETKTCDVQNCAPQFSSTLMNEYCVPSLPEASQTNIWANRKNYQWVNALQAETRSSFLPSGQCSSIPPLLLKYLSESVVRSLPQIVLQEWKEKGLLPDSRILNTVIRNKESEMPQEKPEGTLPMENTNQKNDNAIVPFSLPDKVLIYKGVYQPNITFYKNDVVLSSNNTIIDDEKRRYWVSLQDQNTQHNLSATQWWRPLTNEETQIIELQRHEQLQLIPPISTIATTPDSFSPPTTEDKDTIGSLPPLLSSDNVSGNQPPPPLLSQVLRGGDDENDNDDVVDTKHHSERKRNLQNRTKYSHRTLDQAFHAKWSSNSNSAPSIFLSKKQLLMSANQYPSSKSRIRGVQSFYMARAFHKSINYIWVWFPYAIQRMHSLWKGMIQSDGSIHIRPFNVSTNRYASKQSELRFENHNSLWSFLRKSKSFF
jgi:hypothetical protein